LRQARAVDAVGSPSKRRRPAAGIVVPAWNAWEHTKACLESLRPTLGAFDKVVVVDNGSVDGTKAGLGAFGWAKVLTNEQNRGFAAACNQGAAALVQEVLVFLNSDTVVVGRWLDELLAPFADPSVVASGPRSNFVSGRQLLPGARYTSKAELRSFERSWREAHSGQLDEVGRLVGFCLAVRRSAFEAVEGFDEGYGSGGYEDDDLCRRLVAAGGKLVVAHGSYVHHKGHASFDANGVDWRQAELAGKERFLAAPAAGARPAKAGDGTKGWPKISACLIARDEEVNLPACLSSLRGVADEVVVADTGSTDGTAAIAASFGAKVVQVPWEDHFAKARNAALGHCSGDWVLWLDADEEWVGDGDALHEELAATQDVDGLLVTISNVMGRGIETRTNHPAVRLFRRGLRWEGRVHEQVVRPDGAYVVATMAKAASITHYGYMDNMVLKKDKLERNLRLALAGLDDAQGLAEKGRAELDVGRSLSALGRFAEALGHLEEAALCPEPAVSRLAMHVATRTAMSMGDLNAAARWAGGLRRSSKNPLVADILRAEVAYRARLYDQALEILEKLALPAYDEDNFLHQPSEVAAIGASCYRALGRPAEALQALLGPLASEGVCREPVPVLVHDAQLAGVDLARIGAAFPAEHLKFFLAQLLALSPGDALDVLRGCWSAHPGDKLVLAAAGRVASKASPQAALPWAGRLRERGLGPCPLLSIARDQSRSLADRVLAAAAAARAFGDSEARVLLLGLVPAAGALDRQQVRDVLAALAPELLGLLPLAANAPAGPSFGPRKRVVSIIVPCWDRAPWTLRLLRSLQETLPEGGYELVIVDNGSSDATSRVSSNPDAGVVVVRNERNLGFAVACNQGARAASAETLIFCNNDVVAKAGWLPPLLAALELPRVGVVGAKLLFPNGALQHAGVCVFHDADGEGYLDGAHLLYGQRSDHPLANQARELRAVTGAVMAVRKSFFLELGGFDEGYWNGNEDVDLCLRAGEAGYRVWYEPASVLVHQESASGPERFKQVTANRARLTARWASRVLDDRVTDGVVVVGPFGTGTEADHLARQLVALADEADVPVVTRPWPAPVPGWAHRLGPGQANVLSVLSPTETGAYLAEEGGSLPVGARVVAGRAALAELGLFGENAAAALSQLTGGARRSARSSWRAERADCTVGPKEGL
jgi:GT2 family glycosyltransferase